MTGVATALCLLLSGCALIKRMDETDEKVSQDEKRVEGQLDALKKGAVVKKLTSQWINPYPLAARPEDNSSLPPCPVAINRPGNIALSEVSSYITMRCRLPVVITPDAHAMLTSVAGTTERFSGPVPPPGGMKPLATLGGSASQTSGPSLRGLFWQGALNGLLDNVTTRLGLSWRYERGRVSIFYLDTRTFPVMFMDSKAGFDSRTISGTSTSTGKEGVTGNANNAQTTTMEIKSSLYEDIANTVNSMLTPATGRMNLSAGILTVTDTPRVLEQIGHYMDDRNKELNRQVLLKVHVYKVERDVKDELGVNWSKIINDLSSGSSLKKAFHFDPKDGYTILNTREVDSKALINALSKQENISVVTEASSVTTNLSAVPIQVAMQQDYVDSIKKESATNNGSATTSINKATITTGFNMTVLPYLMPGSSKLQLQFAINISDDPVKEKFETDNSRIELLKTRLKAFSQRVIMQSEQTLILSGYQSLTNGNERQGIGSARFFGLGGSMRNVNSKTMLVIVITPVILG